MRRNILYKILTLLFITLVVYLFWIGLELLVYGSIQTREVDNYISIALVWSLYYNVEYKLEKYRWNSRFINPLKNQYPY